MDIEQHIEEIAHKAVTSPWPGRNGARDFRVLCSILRWVGLSGNRSLSFSTGLKFFAITAGFDGTIKGIQPALNNLMAAGWIKFSVGTPHQWVRGERIPGSASTITLLPQVAEGRWEVKNLPDQRLDLYNRDGAGHAGYLIVAKLYFAGGFEARSVAEIQKLTSLPRSSVYQVMPRLVMHFRKVGSAYRTDDLESALVHGMYGESLYEARIAQYQRKDTDEYIDDSVIAAELGLDFEINSVVAGAEYILRTDATIPSDPASRVVEALEPIQTVIPAEVAPTAPRAVIAPSSSSKYRRIRPQYRAAIEAEQAAMCSSNPPKFTQTLSESK